MHWLGSWTDGLAGVLNWWIYWGAGLMDLLGCWTDGLTGMLD
jgi:hypothetical protein